MGLPEQITEEGKPWTERLTSGSSAKAKLTTIICFISRFLKLGLHNKSRIL